MRTGGGGEAAFRAFVVGRRPALLRTAWLLTGNRDDAEDLVQTALAGLARHWSRVGSAGEPEAYVRRAMVNAHISRWRRARRLVEVPLDESRADGSPGGFRGGSAAGFRGGSAAGSATGSAADPAAGSVDRLVLARALARLTPKQRAVLVLRFYDDLSEGQAAQALGVGVGTVKSQTRHALGRLRALAPELEAFAAPPDRPTARTTARAEEATRIVSDDGANRGRSAMLTATASAGEVDQ